MCIFLFMLQGNVLRVSLKTSFNLVKFNRHLGDAIDHYSFIEDPNPRSILYQFNFLKKLIEWWPMIAVVPQTVFELLINMFTPNPTIVIFKWFFPLF